jgi:Na+/proline symporter
VLIIGLCAPLIVRIVRIAKAQNITSIADFIAARYGKSQAVAATVALIAIVRHHFLRSCLGLATWRQRS